VTDQNIANKKYFSSTGSSIVAQGPPTMVKFSVTMRF
jgi:outer membrane receptor protein involved in Fe transport